MIKTGIGLVFLFCNLLVFSQGKTVDTKKKTTSSFDWNTYSQIFFIHLPEDLGINLLFKEYRNGHILRNPLGDKSEKLHWGALQGFMQFIEKGCIDDPNLTIRVSENCILKKGPLSVAINPKNGGRIESFSWKGKELLVQREIEPVYFGSTLWPDPQSNWWPVDSALDGSAFKIVAYSRDSLALSGTTAKSGLQFEKLFTINSADTSLNITYRIFNRANRVLSVGPWELIRTQGGLVFFPENKINRLPNSNLQGIYSKDSILWYDFDSSLIKKDQKLFSGAREGWLAFTGGGLMFIKSYPDLKQNQIAPGQGQVEIFTNAKATYVENETHGKFEKLRPGAFSTYRVNWYLRPIPPDLPCTKGSVELVKYVKHTLKARLIK